MSDPRVFGRGRSGFTILETIAALGIFAIALILIAQLGTQAIAEQTRAYERLAVIEFANNVLESARARPWAEITPEWAAAQRLPDELSDRLLDPRLTVRVEALPDRPRVKRVAIELNWRHTLGIEARPVEFVALFADRGAEP